jgi:hypothetical protein
LKVFVLGMRTKFILAASVIAAIALPFVMSKPSSAAVEYSVYTPPNNMTFGTSRTLRACPDRSQPSSGRMTVAQATAYVVCKYESDKPYNSTVQFIDVIKLEIAGATRKVSAGDVSRWPQIDKSKPIYDLRGHYILHTCSNLSNARKAGSNCLRGEVTNAKGTCYRDKFGDWSCYIGGQPATRAINQPAPS